MSSAFLALYQCLKSLFKVTDFGPALRNKKKCERIVISNYNSFLIISVKKKMSRLVVDLHTEPRAVFMGLLFSLAFRGDLKPEHCDVSCQ